MYLINEIKSLLDRNEYNTEFLRSLYSVLVSGDLGDLSDGYHTFNSLYYQRMILTAALVQANPEYAWKSHLHEDGTKPFGGGWFIVGFSTPQGEYTYHYQEEYWSLFNCEELPVGKHWDGHTEDDVTRLLSM